MFWFCHSIVPLTTEAFRDGEPGGHTSGVNSRIKEKHQERWPRTYSFRCYAWPRSWVGASIPFWHLASPVLSFLDLVCHGSLIKLGHTLLCSTVSLENRHHITTQQTALSLSYYVCFFPYLRLEDGVPQQASLHRAARQPLRGLVTLVQLLEIKKTSTHIRQVNNQQKHKVEVQDEQATLAPTGQQQHPQPGRIFAAKDKRPK